MWKDIFIVLFVVPDERALCSVKSGALQTAGVEEGSAFPLYCLSGQRSPDRVNMISADEPVNMLHTARNQMYSVLALSQKSKPGDKQ